MDCIPPSQLVLRAWKATGRGRFSEAALIEAVVSLANEASAPKLRLALPSAWLHLDRTGDVVSWINVTGLDAEAIDAIQAAIGAGLPGRDKKSGLHAYSLRPQDFPALLFLAFIAARLATPYVDDGSHRKVRAQFWYAPELAVILLRCLPPKLDLLTVEHSLRTILHPGALGYTKEWIGLPPEVGESPSGYLSEDTMGIIEPSSDDDA